MDLINEIFSLPNQEFFTFILNDGQYSVPRVLADLASPYVRNLHEGDPEKDFFEINDNGCSVLEKILEIYSGKDINFATNDYETVFRILFHIGNRELVKILNNSNNIIIKLFYKKFENEDFSKEISQIAANFDSMGFNSISALPFSVIYDVFINENYKPKSENDFLTAIFRIKDNYAKDEIRKLLEMVKLEKLDDDGIIAYINLVKEVGMNTNICKATFYAIERSEKRKNIPPESITLEPLQNSLTVNLRDIVGIITSEITNRIQTISIPSVDIDRIIRGEEENITSLLLSTDSTSMSVTASSSISRNNPKCILTGLPYEQWVSSDSPNSYITLYFSNRTVMCSRYELTSHDGPSFPKSWKLLGHSTGRWVEMHSVRDCEDICWPNKKASFEITNHCSVDALRLQMTGPSSDNDNFFCLRKFEVWGWIV